MVETKGQWLDSLEYATRSDIGMRRANNQDNLNVVLASTEDEWARNGHLFMVADGMGAHAAGELASKLAVDGVPHHYQKYRDLSAPEALQKALIETNAEVHRRGQANVDFHNMGTTASVLLLLPQGALVAHIGDSRVYRLRGDFLEQLTFDHSLVWEMRAAGQLTGDSPAIPKNVITRSLGPNSSVAVDIEGPFPMQIGDTFLLCSDGLTGEVPDEELGPILASLPPDEAAQVLVDLANLRGGPDNITVLIARVTGARLTGESESTPPLMVGKSAVRPSVHPALWIVMAACFLAMIVLAALDALPLAALAGIGGLVALSLAGWQRFRGGKSGVALTGGLRLGKGPYTSTRCAPTREFQDTLSSIVEELREAALEKNWGVDWDTLDAHCRRAQEAARFQDNREAVSEYARSISFIMDQLRLHNSRKASDSTIDY